MIMSHDIFLQIEKPKGNKNIQGVSKKPQPRNFPRNRHCFKDKRF